MHRWDCTCPACEEFHQKEHRKKQIDDIFAEARRKRDFAVAKEKAKKDKEFSINLNRMLLKGISCIHSRPLAEGEKWEDTFCNVLGTTCVLIKGEFCPNEVPIEDEESHVSKHDDITSKVSQPNIFNEEFAYNKIYNDAANLLKSSKSWTDIKCPKCGAKTTLRTVIKGKDKGKQFYVCINNPKCRGRVRKK